MSTLLEKFYGEMSWKVDKAGPAQFEKQKAGIANGLKKIAGLYTAAAGIVTGFVAVTNKNTAAQYRLAQSLGVSFEWLDRWGDATADLGVGADAIGTAITHLNRTIGNVKLNPGQAESVSDALKLIGLNLKDVAGADTETRFDAVVSALGNVEDQTTVTAAAFKLFGRGGGATFAKLAELARAEGRSVLDLIGRFDDLGIETDASARSALEFTRQAEAIKFAFDEVRATIAGYVGEALLPMLKGTREWIANNRELIRSKLAEWARGTVTWLSGVWHFVSLIGKAIGPLVSAFGGLGNVLRMSAIGYLAVKLAAATKGVKDLSIAFGGLTKLKVKEFFTGSGGVAGLAAIAMYALSDLWDSISDISNDSWGNRIARQMLKVSDYAVIWVAEMAGLYFQSDADREAYIAANMNYTASLMNDSLANIGIFADNVKNLVIRTVLVINTIWSAMFASGDFATNIRNGLVIAQKEINKYQSKDYQDTRQKDAAQMAWYGGGRYRSDMAKQWYGAVKPVTANITVNPSAGMDEKALANQVVKQLEKEMKKAVRLQTAAGVAQ